MTLTQKQPHKMNSSLTASNFLEFFAHKIESIRKVINGPTTGHSDLQGLPPRILPDTRLQQFNIISLDELDKITQASKPTTCMLDPVPTKVLKELFPTVGTTMLNIVNLSLSSGIVPPSFKCAIVKPLLKKPGLDPEALSSYRPISNLPFLSKVPYFPHY